MAELSLKGVLKFGVLEQMTEREIDSLLVSAPSYLKA